MIAYALVFAMGCIGLAMVLNLVRLVQGPTSADRILALDTLTINVIALIILLGLKVGSPIAFEAALLLAMLGFLGTVAYCKFLLRGDIVE